MGGRWGSALGGSTANAIVYVGPAEAGPHVRVGGCRIATWIRKYSRTRGAYASGAGIDTDRRPGSGNNPTAPTIVRSPRQSDCARTPAATGTRGNAAAAASSAASSCVRG